MSGSRRVVVTGTGVGPDWQRRPDLLAGLKEGCSGVGPLRDIDFPEQNVCSAVQIACQVKDFDTKTASRTACCRSADRDSHLPAAAARRGLEHQARSPLANLPLRAHSAPAPVA